VGYFIGSPGMNLIPIDFDDKKPLIGSQPLGIDLRDIANSGKLELGIRPEFITLNGNAEGFEMTVQNIENVGKHKIVRGAIGEHGINIIIPENNEIDSDTVFVNFDRKHTMIYSDGALVEGTENG
jgi:glycerol transport system ATP-binding protein